MYLPQTDTRLEQHHAYPRLLEPVHAVHRRPDKCPTALGTSHGGSGLIVSSHTGRMVDCAGRWHLGKRRDTQHCQEALLESLRMYPYAAGCIIDDDQTWAAWPVQLRARDCGDVLPGTFCSI